MTQTFCPTPSNWKNLARHEYSAEMGDMTEAEFAMLVHDMELNGFQGRPILLFGNKTLEVLDGWHQLRAASLTGKTPVFEKYTGTDPFGEVWRRHGPRKHWNESQRAMIGARVAQRTSVKSSRISPLANLPTNAQAAETLNVSQRSIGDAKKVLQEGTPALQHAVANGQVAVSDAAKIAGEPAKVQNAAVKAVEKGKSSTVRKAVQDREPGDDTEIEKAQKKADRQAVKDNGIQVQELNKTVEKMIGQLTRAFDDRARVMGKGAGHKGCLAAMENVLKAWKAWKSAK